MKSKGSDEKQKQAYKTTENGTNKPILGSYNYWGH